jgi:hypothetical protein
MTNPKQNQHTKIKSKQIVQEKKYKKDHFNILIDII